MKIMNFDKAAKLQNRYSTFWTIFLIGPNGEKEYVGFSSRKSGRSLLGFISRESFQERVGKFEAAGSIRIVKKTSESLVFSNGWKLAFGGTIRQESSAAD